MKRSLFALAMAAALPMSAQASDFDYSYFEVGFTQQDYGYSDSSQSGYTASGSLGFAENFYVSGTYRQTDGISKQSFYFNDTDSDYWDVNFGYHRSVNANNDFIAEIGYADWSSDYQYYFYPNTPWFGGQNDDSGVRFAVGLRTAIGDKWETVAKLGRQGGGDDYFEGLTTAEVGVMYKINPNWGVSFNTKMVNDWETHYTLSVRGSFGGNGDNTSSNSSSSDEHAFSYSYIQAGVTALDYGYGDQLEPGFDVRGSIGFANNYYVRALYSELNAEEDKRYEVGFGYHTEMTPSNDFVADVSYGHYEYCPSSGCGEEGFNVSAGIRTAITKRLEASAMLGYNTGGDYMYDNLTTAKLGLSYNISNNFDAVFEAEMPTDFGTFYTFGVRATF